MQKLLELKSDGKVLDIGCGTGENAVFLAEKGFDVDAMDVSESSLIDGRNLAFSKHVFVDFFKKDARNFRTEESFDIVLCLGMLHFLTRDEALQLVKYMKKNVKVGGFFVIETMLGHFENEELKKLFYDWDIIEYNETRQGEKIRGNLIALRLR